MCTFKRDAAGSRRPALRARLALGLVLAAHGAESSEASAPTQVPAAAPVTGSAALSLPLDELLRLYRESDRSRAAPLPPPPPVGATLDRVELDGRLLEDALEVRARIAVTVLDRGWVSVPILARGPRTSVAELPALKGATLAVRDGYLCLLAGHAGSYAFEVSLLERAEQKGGGARRVELGLGAATLAVLRLKHDESLFQLRDTGGRRTPDGVLLYPRGERLVVEWEQVAELRHASASQARPAIDPTIPRAQASIVSTLEGLRIGRYLYELRFEGARQVSVRLPAGQRLEKVYLNGSAVAPGSEPLAAPERLVRFDVTPARAGDQSGTLEIVVSEERRGYALSGDLEIELPHIDWPVSVIDVELNLPPVFNYTWTGGSLSPGEDVALGEFSHKLPLPGKRLTLRQYLIATSAPSARLSYTVDLDGRYFR